MRSTTGPAYSYAKPDAALHAERPDDGEDDVLGVHARRERAADGDAPHLQRVHGEALRRQDVADLRGADAEGHGAERPVRGGVAVAAGDGHPRLGEAELRADDVDDALVVAAEAEQRHAELAAVALEGRHHLLRHLVGEGAGLAVGGHDVVDRREGAIRKRDALAAQAQHVEGLGAGDLVHQVQADEQLRLPRRQAPDRVQVPDFLEAV